MKEPSGRKRFISHSPSWARLPPQLRSKAPRPPAGTRAARASSKGRRRCSSAWKSACRRCRRPTTAWRRRRTRRPRARAVRRAEPAGTWKAAAWGPARTSRGRPHHPKLAEAWALSRAFFISPAAPTPTRSVKRETRRGTGLLLLAAFFATIFAPLLAVFAEVALVFPDLARVLADFLALLARALRIAFLDVLAHLAAVFPALALILPNVLPVLADVPRVLGRIAALRVTDRERDERDRSEQSQCKFSVHGTLLLTDFEDGIAPSALTPALRSR